MEVFPSQATELVLIQVSYQNSVQVKMATPALKYLLILFQRWSESALGAVLPLTTLLYECRLSRQTLEQENSTGLHSGNNNL